MNYYQFFKQNAQFLLFGLFFTFFSGFGQTFFISLFSEEIRNSFELSHGSFGLIYSLATLSSAATLIFVGRYLDRTKLINYTIWVCVGFIVASSVFAFAPAVLWLGIGIYGLRLSCQGLMTHTSMTSMARYFDAQRGKASSIATMGFPLSEAIFPVLGVATMQAVGWRNTWLVVSVLGLLVVLPTMIGLLRGHQQRHTSWLQNMKRVASTTVPLKNWRMKEVLKDVRFYLVAPAVLTPAFVNTGIFFHQVALVEAKGWSLTWYATCFTGYAAATVVAAVIVGWLIDRWNAIQLLPFYLLPIGVGLITLALLDSPWIALLYMVLAGFTGGSASVLTNAMWAELYGVASLGTIRSVASAMMVFSSALSPVLLGIMLDAGFPMSVPILLCLAFAVAAVVPLIFLVRLQQRE
ncbi:MAG: MFS transporter, partial [Tunicatimonas sp.]|uniref:MFS transporter n=1 Tax=Tunicatimonas sp. TaxID=1940096 RepID=UPI003C73E765